jgi:hypothetical protein
MCNALNNDPVKIAQELDVSFVGSSNNVVDPSYIEQQRIKNVREPDPELHDEVLEDVWIWKLPIEGHQYILSIDNSRGDADDATAMEIFDLNGIDDDGMPCIEQVLEYNGKLFGDVIGELANNYGRLYNNAFCVVESIGGYGDATLITLMNLEYPNLYYDDVELKDYMRQGRSSSLKPQNGKMPGFHNGNNRFQMLSNFANMVRTDQFKIRSKRVIAELETWVWKNGKMDHMDGFHDDTITCLAMGLFVVQFSMKKELRNKAMDETMLRAMIEANSRIRVGRADSSALPAQKKYAPQIYVSREPFEQDKSAAYKASMWLFG